MFKRYAFLLLAALLALGLIQCSRNRNEVAARTPDVDFYIQYASERFGVPAEEISVVEFKPGTSGRRSKTVWPLPTEKYTIPPIIRLEWGGKTVSFVYSYFGDFYDTTYLHNDYYYDELYEGLRQYYLDRLHVKDVIPMLEVVIGIDDGTDYSAHYSEGIRYYLRRHEVTKVDTSVIEDLIHSEDIVHAGDESKVELLVALEGTDPEAEIRQLIDDMMKLNHEIASIQVLSSLDGISVFRVPEKNRRDQLPIDRQLISGINYSTRWTRIRPVREGESFSPSKEYQPYQGYCYSTAYLPGFNEQGVDTSTGADTSTGEQ